MDPTPRRPAVIAADLRRLGLSEGDLVMVHASLRKVGPLEGRADGLIDAIGEVLGERGTMMMVLGAADDHAWVNERPEAERAALLADAEPFDAHVTPAAADVGKLAEVFRRRPETRVSDHPEGRFAASGSLADELVRDVPWDDYFGPGSPLERLVERRGKVLRLGADHNTVTALHHAEYRCSVEPKRRVRRHRSVATSDGPRVRVVECLDDEEGIVDYPGEDYFADLLRDYLTLGRHRAGPVGDASSELLDAADIVDYGERWMDEHLDPEVPHWTIETLGARLDADLSAARRAHRRPETVAIGSLRTALANAEAVPVEERPYRIVEGIADVPRLELDGDAIRAVVGHEIEERRRAIGQYRAAGLETAELEVELKTLERYRAGS